LQLYILIPTPRTNQN